ncbi:DUF1330 domain-containing protein [Microbulbifer epialgicus]|uniref:DUF1330 domain-containing protein n=1 Tax=Microbulbifer epialgicus TaxID=393907 RepID=A0ABV4P6F7_9GAMM
MKGYLVLDLSVVDKKGFLEYAKKIPEFIKKYGGRYIVKGVVPEVVEGNWSPERLVVLEFPSMERVKGFLGDQEVKELFLLRHSTTNSRLILAEGCV